MSHPPPPPPPVPSRGGLALYCAAMPVHSPVPGRLRRVRYCFHHIGQGQACRGRLLCISLFQSVPAALVRPLDPVVLGARQATRCVCVLWVLRGCPMYLS